jgi:hypothetical protein
MAGCVQVNARVHARGSDWPLDPMTSADWAGGHDGALGARDRLLAGGAAALARRLGVLDAAAGVPGAGQAGSDQPAERPVRPLRVRGSASVRRNGAIHLATAESQAGW